MEVIGEPGGVAVVDDFGHHPTAVAVTLKAARSRWPGRRLWAVFEPRSATSRRNHFENEYVEAFGGADCVVIGHHPRLQEVTEDQRFSPERVAARVRNGSTEAWGVEGTEAIAEHVAEKTRPEDVVIVFSNGDFGGLHALLLDQLGR